MMRVQATLPYSFTPMTSTLSVPAEAKLRTADDFLIRVSAPVRGHLRLKVRVGQSPRVRLSLSAAQDELMKLRTWMEDIARGVSPALIRFADGTALCCRREYDDATGFAETERFLDEAYPTSVSTFCVRDAQGREYRALLKTKHFLNYLYLCLLTGGNPDLQDDYLQHFSEHWYTHTPQKQHTEHLHYHYRCFSSRLLEWYFCCQEAVPRRIPRFKPLPDNTAFLLMWADFGGALFWNDDNECCGACEQVWIGEEEIPLSDIPELSTWEYDFHDLGLAVLRAREHEWQFPYGAIAEADRVAWHVRGQQLAHQLRPRLPLHYVLLYEQSWDLAYGTPYFANDSGRIIFDERFIEKEEA